MSEQHEREVQFRRERADAICALERELGYFDESVAIVALQHCLSRRLQRSAMDEYAGSYDTEKWSTKQSELPEST